MERKGEINETCVRFWTAELASACNYLHRQKIIHRYVFEAIARRILVTDANDQLISVRSDIKPDNVLLDAHGHVHLTDFNVAIHYSERRLHTSVAGSIAYMAPEILARMSLHYTLPLFYRVWPGLTFPRSFLSQAKVTRGTWTTGAWAFVSLNSSSAGDRLKAVRGTS